MSNQCQDADTKAAFAAAKDAASKQTCCAVAIKLPKCPCRAKAKTIADDLAFCLLAQCNNWLVQTLNVSFFFVDKTVAVKKSININFNATKVQPWLASEEAVT